MKYCNPRKDTDLFSMIDHQDRVTSQHKGINKLNMVIDWELFREELESLLGYGKRDPRKGGRPPFDALFFGDHPRE
jgi:hypothetical protein